MRRAAALLAISALVGPCRAQEAFVFSWDVKDIAGTGPTNANGVIEPGEDAQIFFNVSFRPGVGGTAIWDTLGGAGQVGIVGGLGWTSGNIIADQGLNTGDWTAIGYRSGFNLGVTAIVDPPQNHLLSWGFGQFLLPGESPNSLNDTWFFWARWRPHDYVPREVRFHYERTTGQTDNRVILNIGTKGSPNYVADAWAFNMPQGSVVIVPAPGVAITAAYMGCVLSRRWRRRTILGGAP